MGKSINDVKRDVSKSFQAWVQYPDTIKNNKYRVVMSDTKTHYFNGIDESYCATYKCGTVENERPGVTFYSDVPGHVQKQQFCMLCRKHNQKKVAWVAGSKAFKDLPYHPSPTDGMGNSE